MYICICICVYIHTYICANICELTHANKQHITLINKAMLASRAGAAGQTAPQRAAGGTHGFVVNNERCQGVHVSRNRARSQVLLQAHKLRVYFTIIHFPMNARINTTMGSPVAGSDPSPAQREPRQSAHVEFYFRVLCSLCHVLFLLVFLF